MTTSTAPTAPDAVAHVPEQLRLMVFDDSADRLPPSDVPVRFRLDQRTRERGLAHIAAIRAQLAARRGQPVPSRTRAA